MSLSYAVADNLVLDARRAAWLPKERVLAVADLHLGYAWAHRLHGQLLPVGVGQDTRPRLLALQREYQPAAIVVLGDIVHQAEPLEPLRDELELLCKTLAAGSELIFLAGNHDRSLQKVLNHWKLPVRLNSSYTAGPFLLVHGDVAAEIPAGARQVLMGHEHPAISISDGVTTSHKCPCFLLGSKLIVLPAFSNWAAGTDIRQYRPMSPMAQRARFHRAIAVCGEHLLPVDL